jgi:hypothetical protein
MHERKALIENKVSGFEYDYMERSFESIIIFESV